ncbi:hypothetical protein ACK3SF_01070 [Candidatus Nanosalina sp. VS9-1]|uniref:hypothetical protein n=1 Tax=Candidatus Nanosalina sp. VS9-1 TaxID=3388566 RepID=UPI0039E1C98B
MDRSEELVPADAAAKSAEIEVVDFHGIVESFENGGLDDFDSEVDTFLEESERAGRSRPVLYVDEGLYGNVSQVAEVGAVNGNIPVRLLPKQTDLFAMLNRFSFDEGVKDVLEGGRALLVNPGGGTGYEGVAYLQVGEDVAQQAYDSAVSDIGAREYLETQRGVDVMDLPGGGLEVQVDESSIGRDFDYVEDDSLVLQFGDEKVELEYDRVRAGNQDEVYKFVIE